MMTRPRSIGMDKTILRRQPEQRDFVEEANASGRVAQLIERHGVVRLLVAPPITTGVA